jgi:hypothetical protein
MTWRDLLQFLLRIFALCIKVVLLNEAIIIVGPRTWHGAHAVA